MGRKAVFDRRNQPTIKLRTDELTKEQLSRMCEKMDISVQQFLETVIKEKITEFYTKQK